MPRARSAVHCGLGLEGLAVRSVRSRKRKRKAAKGQTQTRRRHAATLVSVSVQSVAHFRQ